ncbi:hypothetical protein pdam_00007870 [Pocillopora damicornis]|uniref:Ammonium transporter AmtB-like domain-containing protein n=1 Tax=Pocillopora damicornis TaxID=46731 RepID=A0A3M6T8K8_POCDA|nr:hypothetical protein pdam_00007870 [Pocillopora damicornis]
MTFLKKYGYSGVGYNFFIAALLSQWGAIVNGCFNQIYIDGKDHIEIGLRSLISAEYAAVTVLISFGVVLGKVSRLQLLVIGILDILFYAVNNLLAVKYLKYSDAGGSIFLHAFAAYFGLALSWILYNENSLDNYNEGSSYHSDISAMIAKSLKIHDTCGVHNLHGIPGIFGGIAGAVITALAQVDSYGYEGLFSVWGARAPKMNSIEYWELKNMSVKFDVGDERSAFVQAGYQVAGIMVTLAISIFGGIVTGLIVKREIFDPPAEEQLFDDEDFWVLPQKHIEGYENID